MPARLPDVLDISLRHIGGLLPAALLVAVYGTEFIFRKYLAQYVWPATLLPLSAWLLHSLLSPIGTLRLTQTQVSQHSRFRFRPEERVDWAHAWAEIREAREHRFSDPLTDVGREAHCVLTLVPILGPSRRIEADDFQEARLFPLVRQAVVERARLCREERATGQDCDCVTVRYYR